MRRRATRIAIPVGAALGVGLLLGCPSHTVLGPEDFEPAQRVVEKTVEAEVPEVAGGFELVGLDDPALQAAVAEFRSTGKPPVVRHPRAGFVTYPYGESQPVLTCAPLRVCEIELQAGEEILDVALGDAIRWHAEKMESGPEQARIPHVVVKPTEGGLATNLVISTTRRVYHLALLSKEKGGPATARRARFYYPHEMVARWKSARARARADRAAHEREVVATDLPVRPEDLNFGYEVKGDRTTWRPTQVFDDGTRVYLRMPAAMRVTEAPALFVLTAGQEKALVNYRVRGHTYVVDRLFERAVLVLGVGGEQQRVEIVRLPRAKETKSVRPRRGKTARR